MIALRSINILMGKKRITNKFAAVKRIISTQDHRTYSFYKLESKTKPKSKSTIVNVNRHFPNRHPTMLKFDKCNILPISVPKNLPVSSLHIITLSVHPIAS